jgi:predicted nucleic acid-binding protein
VKVLLDTNVVSVFSGDSRDPDIEERVKRLAPADTFISSISIAEIAVGVKLLPVGRRRTSLDLWLDGLEREFAGRILPVDAGIGRVFGEIVAIAKRRGHNIQATDGLIAATAIHHGLHVMTRNVKHFEPTGVLLINPWDE